MHRASLAGHCIQRTPCADPMHCMYSNPQRRTETRCMQHRVGTGHTLHATSYWIGLADWLKCSPIQTSPRANAQVQTDASMGVACSTCPRPIPCAMYTARSSLQAKPTCKPQKCHTGSVGDSWAGSYGSMGPDPYI